MVFKEMMATVVGILLVGGLGYWVNVLFKKYRFVIKYKIFRRSHDEDDVRVLIQFLDAKTSAEDVGKLILLDPQNKRSLIQVKELLYIYSELEKIERRRNK